MRNVSSRFQKNKAKTKFQKQNSFTKGKDNIGIQCVSKNNQLRKSKKWKSEVEKTVSKKSSKTFEVKSLQKTKIQNKWR